MATLWPVSAWSRDWMHCSQSLPEARMSTLLPVFAWSWDCDTMASLCLKLEWLHYGLSLPGAETECTVTSLCLELKMATLCQ